MKILIDSDVLLDVLADRKPFVDASAAVWALVEAKRIEGVVSALSFSNTFTFFVNLCREVAFVSVRKLAQVFEIAPVDGRVIGQALASTLPDFEDALQAFSASTSGATHVVSRDATGFVGGPLVVLTPAELLAALAQSKGES